MSSPQRELTDEQLVVVVRFLARLWVEIARGYRPVAALRRYTTWASYSRLAVRRGQLHQPPPTFADVRDVHVCRVHPRGAYATAAIRGARGARGRWDALLLELRAGADGRWIVTDVHQLSDLRHNDGTVTAPPPPGQDPDSDSTESDGDDDRA